MNIDISNKVVVITGSSRGIGKEMAKKLAEEKAKVVINYSKSDDDALLLFTKLTEVNQNCLLVKADVTKQNEAQRLCKETIKAYGQVNVLINNAGMCSDNLLPIMTEKQWKQVLNVNLNSVFLCSRYFSKEMIKQKQGKILNIASLKGQLGCEGQTNYCASKAGVIGFTKALAKELGRYDISVNAICPGFIVTDLNRKNKEKREIAEKMSVLSSQKTLDDLLNFMIYISSDNFNSVSGRVFNIDSRIIGW